MADDLEQAVGAELVDGQVAQLVDAQDLGLDVGRQRLLEAAGSVRGDQLVVAAVAAAQPQEAVGQDAAFEEGVEFVLHELRQVGTCGGFGLGDEGRGVLLHRMALRFSCAFSEVPFCSRRNISRTSFSSVSSSTTTSSE